MFLRRGVYAWNRTLLLIMEGSDVVTNTEMDTFRWDRVKEEEPVFRDDWLLGRQKYHVVELIKRD